MKSGPTPDYNTVHVTTEHHLAYSYQLTISLLHGADFTRSRSFS